MSLKTFLTNAGKKCSLHGGQMFLSLQHSTCFMTCLAHLFQSDRGCCTLPFQWKWIGNDVTGELRNQEAVPADRPLGLAAR